MIRREHAGDGVAIGMAEDYRGRRGERADHRGDVVCQIVQREAFHRASGTRDASRLRPQDLPTGRSEISGENIEILATTAAVRRQDHHRWAAALNVGLDLDVEAAHGLDVLNRRHHDLPFFGHPARTRRSDDAAGADRLPRLEKPLVAGVPQPRRRPVEKSEGVAALDGFQSGRREAVTLEVHA